MSNPNLLTISSVIGKSLAQDVTTVGTAIVENALASGRVYKINVLFVSNIDSVADSSVIVEFVRAGVATKIADLVQVAAGSTLVVIAKDTALYLEEGDSLKIAAAHNGRLQAVISYEMMS